MARLPSTKAGYMAGVDPMPPRMQRIAEKLTAAGIWPEWPVGVVLTWGRGSTWYQGIAGKAVGGPPDAIMDLRQDVNAGPILDRMGRAGAAPNLHFDLLAAEWTVEASLAGRLLVACGETIALAAAGALCVMYGLLTPEEAEAE